MQNSPVYSSCPVIKVEDADLVERILIGSGTIMCIPFVQKLIWIRETSAKISYWHGDKMLKEGSEYSDFYGFFTSYENALEDAEKSLKYYKIDPNSSLEIRIELTVNEFPVLENLSDDAKRWNSGKNKMYSPLPDKFWFVKDEEKMKEYVKTMNQPHDENSLSDKFSAYDLIAPLRIQNKVLAKEILVWSSKNDMSQILEELKSKYIIKE